MAYSCQLLAFIDVIVYEVGHFVALADQNRLAFLVYQHDRRKKSSVVLGRLGVRVCTAVEQGEDLAQTNLRGQQAMIGQATVTLVVEINVASIAQRAGEFVRCAMLVARAFGGDQVVVPLVGLHREEEIESGISEKPCVSC